MLIPFHWPLATPESQGVDSAAVIRLLDHVRDQQVNLHSLIMVRQGRLILEAYRHPYHAASRHDVRSIAKGVTALLIGIALDQGHLTHLDQRLLDFFPNRTTAQRDARKEAITLRHLITMSSGLALSDSDSGHFLTEPDALQWALDAPMAAEPGSQFVYSSSNLYLLSAVIQEVTGQPLLDYANAKLFGPLGIDAPRWQTSPQGITLGWGGLWMASSDLAKIGQLALARGQWNGVQVVPAAWIDAATHVQAAGVNYGFGWWIELESRAVMMTGYGGQFVHVWPEQDLVIVITSGLRDPDALLRGGIESFIRPALHREPLPENPGAAADLAARIAALGRPQPQPVPPLPEGARRLSGRRWTLAENGLGLTAITLTFGEDVAVLALESGQDRAAIPLGLDGVLRDVLVERLGPLADQDRMAAVGAWQDDHMLVLRVYSVNNPEYWTVEIAFEEERAHLHWEDMLTGYAETVAAWS